MKNKNKDKKDSDREMMGPKAIKEPRFKLPHCADLRTLCELQSFLGTFAKLMLIDTGIFPTVGESLPEHNGHRKQFTSNPS